MANRRKARTRGQLMLECFHTLRRSLGKRFNAPVFQVPDEANNLMPGRRALRKETKPDTLHITANEEPARYLVTHLILTGSPC